MYFFMFSFGEYSDYCVGGLYCSDHEIPEKEWQEFNKAHKEQKEKLREKVPTVDSGRGERYPRMDYDSAEYEEWSKFPSASDLFIEKHGLMPVAYAEFWEY